MRNSPRASQCKRFDMGVKMEYDKHTEIEPKHKQHNSGQASVDIGVIAEMLNVKCIQIRESDPAHSTYQRSGKLLHNGGFAIRNGDIADHKEQHQHCESQQPPHAL